MQETKPYAVEMPVELIVDGHKMTTFMCTPHHLEDLALGHLLNRGMIANKEQLHSITVDEQVYKIYVTTVGGLAKELYSVPQFVLSGCSSVASFSEEVYQLAPLSSKFATTLPHLAALAQKMQREAIIYNSTGGVHAAAIQEGEGLLLREDIGRHNAVDKVVGAAVQKGVDLRACAVVITGRISLDMLLKSAAAQIPMVVSFKYPSDMGIKLAEHFGICIVGRILSDTPCVYTTPWRIK